jgi:hypothetical protein
MATEILSVWILAAAGIQLGTLWIMKTSILPLLNALPYDRYVNTCQLIDMHVFHPIALWNGIIAAGIGAYLAVVAPSAPASALFAIGAVSMLIVGITSEGVNRPIWRQIEMWSPRRIASRWHEKRRTWHLAHETRTFGGLVAATCFAVATILVVAA